LKKKKKKKSLVESLTGLERGGWERVGDKACKEAEARPSENQPQAGFLLRPEEAITVF
jgi:hypothetical protein